MIPTLGRRAFGVLIATMVLTIGATGYSQTPLNYVYMPEIQAANGELLAYPIYIKNGEPVDFVCAPLAFEPPMWVRLDSVSTVGSRIDGLGKITVGWSQSTRKLFVDFDADSGTPLPPGDGLLATVHLKIGQNAPTHDIFLDSTFIGPNLTYMILDVERNRIDDLFIKGIIHVVTQRPIIHLDPTTFTFSTYVGVNPPTQNLSITNLGVDPLNWSVSYQPTWLDLSANNGTAPSNVILGPNVTGLGIGVYSDSLVVSDANAEPKSVTAYITLEIAEEPGFQTRCIALHEGWNLISWNLDTPSDNIESLIANIKGCVVRILSFEAGAMTYDPELPQFSTLQSADHLHGYWFKMDCDTTLCITGAPVAPAFPIDLESNWNLVSYLPESGLEPEIGLQSVIDELVVVLGYDNGGLSYDPANPELATLEVLEQNFGYWLKTTAPATLVYPGPDPRIVTLIPTVDKPAPLSNLLNPTREWVNIYGDGLRIDGQLLTAGSLLEVFDDDGVLCGVALVASDGHLNFTPIYLDDKSTAADEGAEYGGRVAISVNGEPATELIELTGFGENVRLNNLTSVTKLNDALPRDFVLKQNFPNPFNPSTMIEFSLPAAGNVKVEIFNLLGERINTLVDRFMPAGNYLVSWLGDDLYGRTAASGIYFYRVSAGEFAATRKMMLVK